METLFVSSGFSVESGLQQFCTAAVKYGVDLVRYARREYRQSGRCGFSTDVRQFKSVDLSKSLDLRRGNTHTRFFSISVDSNHVNTASLLLFFFGTIDFFFQRAPHFFMPFKKQWTIYTELGTGR